MAKYVLVPVSSFENYCSALRVFDTEAARDAALHAELKGYNGEQGLVVGTIDKVVREECAEISKGKLKGIPITLEPSKEIPARKSRKKSRKSAK